MPRAMEREALKSLYPNPRWALKVKKMSDAQAVAVYMRLRMQNKL